MIEFLEIPAGDLESHPGNWRDHPEQQVGVMGEILDEIGVADALLAYYSERNGGKLTLINGHLRKGLNPHASWPVLVTDLTDAEADYMLAVYDPVTALAQVDAGALDALLDAVRPNDGAVRQMLDELAAEAGLYVPNLSPDIDYGQEVTGEDVEQAADRLANQFADGANKQLEMLCPACGQSFFVNRWDLEKLLKGDE